MGHGVYQTLRKDHGMFGRSVEAVPRTRLCGRSRFDALVLMPQNDRPPSAHKVDVFASVDIGHPCAFATSEELRIALRHADAPTCRRE